MNRHIRPIRIEGNIAYITLTKGFEAVIDVCDLHIVSGRSWSARVSPQGTAYAFSSKKGDVTRRKTLYLHREILQPEAGLQVDHIDGDGLNNRRCNLRAVSSAQNQFNQRLRVNNKSGVKGVYWCKLYKKWNAKIRVYGKCFCIGTFDNKADAVEAVSKARDQLHGEFARHAYSNAYDAIQPTSNAWMVNSKGLNNEQA